MATPLQSLRRPALAAPMAGGPSTAALVLAAVDAGGTGFLAGGYLTAERLAEQVEEVGRGADVFGVNLFVPERAPLTDAVRAYRESLLAEHPDVPIPEPAPDDDGWSDKLELVLDAGVPLVSFTFGFPTAEVVEALQRAGSTVVATVTTADEARTALDRGADVLCAQGPDAGGHRATFDQAAEPATRPLSELLSAVRGTAPLVAAGGLASPAAVTAARAAGADAVQIGTALLVADEAGTPPAHRGELFAGERDVALTRAFSGRWAQGLVNDFLRAHAGAPSGYPYVNQLTSPIRAAAKKAGEVELMSLWAGRRYREAQAGPAGEILDRLCPADG
ncbi:nitronate monooxygenase [Georgenia halophila]|uniref:Propionate 3-nitronate monooxygenase n=1 Tax=Georgenia halophila TaxID=620889 RepID=A0ABP8KTD2_9MICO